MLTSAVATRTPPWKLLAKARKFSRTCPVAASRTLTRGAPPASAPTTSWPVTTLAVLDRETGWASVGDEGDDWPPPVVGQVRLRLLTDVTCADLRGPTACQLQTPDEVAARIEAVEKKVGPDRVRWVHPDCGFWMLKRGIADGKIRALVRGRDLYEKAGASAAQPST